MRRLAILPAILFILPLMASEPAGTVKTSEGTAQILRQGQYLAAKPGTTVEVSDSIVTGSDGRVGITLKDDTRLTAGPDSTMELRRFVFDTTTYSGNLDASVTRGSLAVISGKIAKANPEAVRFSTPSVTLGVRGTRFIIQAGK